MAITELVRTRLQGLWRQSVSSSKHAYQEGGLLGRRRRRRPASAFQQQHHSQSTTAITGLEIARFGLLSLATLPFTSWLALFSYDYYYRVELCQKALTDTDHAKQSLPPPSSLSSTLHESSPAGAPAVTHLGRERQFKELSTLLTMPPHQIIVVAGPNESGKTHFVSSLLHSSTTKQSKNHQGMVYIQSSQIVDSISTLTQTIVRAFQLNWLQLRHALVDILPFAGSEILVMKERYSERDLAQALQVITEALELNRRIKQQHHHGVSTSFPRPVIVIDGLGEGSSWFRSPEGRRALQQLFKWCITITKERGLAHVILTGNEELVISLTDQNRMTRGHVHVIGLSTLDNNPATKDHHVPTLALVAPIIWQEWPDAQPLEIQKLIDTFGGFIHDLQTASRQIQHQLKHYEEEEKGEGSSKTNQTSMTRERRRAQIIDHVLAARFRLQVERVTAAFAKGKDESTTNTTGSGTEEEEMDHDNDNENDEMDPYLDPLKQAYSEAHAAKNISYSGDDHHHHETLVSAKQRTASWSQLQLWRTLQRLVESSSDGSNNYSNMKVPFGDLRDEIFNGDTTPLLELMNEDILGFEIGELIGNDPWTGGESHNRNNSTGSSSGVGGGDSLSPQEWSWQVKPATPALGRVFHYLVHNSQLRERFQELERVAERREALARLEEERQQLRLERRRLDMRKASLLQTAKLGSALDMDKSELSKTMKQVYETIVSEEVAMEQRGLQLRMEQARLLQESASVLQQTQDDSSPDSSNDHVPMTTTTTAVTASLPSSSPPVVSTKTTISPPPISLMHDHVSIQKHLKTALLDTCEQEEDRIQNVRESFQKHAQSEHGTVTAEDIVRLIKETTGDEITMEMAESFIREWDSNQDNRLDYDEFIEMLTADAKMLRKRKRKKKPTINAPTATTNTSSGSNTDDEASSKS